MKKKTTFKERVTTISWVIPIPVMIIVSAILTYWIGAVMTEINSLYSNVADVSRHEFMTTIVKLIAIWITVKLVNSFISTLSSRRVLDKGFMKWINKLTYSSVSSISKIGTGGIQNAIGTIAQCDRAMVNSVVNILPFLAPFVIICQKEYSIAGIVPVVVNISTMVAYVGLYILMTKLKSNEIAARVQNEMSAVTTDCIMNSKTVKYFQRESWSIKLQSSTQKRVFFDSININKRVICNLFGVITWIPTITNVFLCWSNLSVVLFIVMTDYAIHNISGSIADIMEIYTEKKSQLKVLGKLEPDNIERVPLGDKLTISDVAFKYDEKSEVSFIIDNITIEKGHRYCITGKSGFGKSTFIKLVTNTVVPTKGNIDKIDCIYMFAESQMFNQSIYDNICIGDETVSMEEVEETLKELEVDVDYKLTESIGERGERLSTGQIQRINLARVLVYARRHPNCLIALDEVTSALDEDTSVKGINYLTSEFERLGTTLLYVSNKSDYKSSNLITDNIYVIRDGNTVTYVQE